jgi:outer membrane protein assembly factor BamA
VLESLPGSEWVVGPLFRFELSTYDDLFVPRRGLEYRVHASYTNPAMGASSELFKVEASSERVLPLARRVLLRGGWEFGLSLGDTVWSEMFHVGSEVLPGYAWDEFTVRHKAIGTAGLDFLLMELFGRQSSPLYLQVFAGVATFERLDRLLEADDMRQALTWSAGVGLLANTPVGPVRLTFGAADFAKPESFAYPGIRWNFFLSFGRDFRYTR